ncbi:ML domain-containing protein [Thamnocephalis sphaerospora]|uniref:Phosphatidylglycerol/phosphatidylinositol transfer protein n=1 Tax=Thamnocephalis sphaerospora TaxID=78915 RepID=A0A4P9XYM0_9FUNG|nr:ML domain-containing protein [Thamnocephalis sphaerospora]|eukprot:RKP10530.1 ML domain-containing protein [Thamnocephalis sphaerospora]
MKGTLASFCGILAVSGLLLADVQPVTGGSVLWQLGNDDLLAPPNSRYGKPLGPSLFDCSKDQGTLHIEFVKLSPDPPSAGEKLLIRARGTFDTPVEEGSEARVIAKYGFIQVLNKKYDLCKEIKAVGLECPLGPGTVTLEKEIDLPRAIPPGSYFANVKVTDANEELLTCLNAKVSFDL